MKRKRRDLPKRWQCPGCGHVLENPIGLLEAVCQRVTRHKSQKTMAMKPVKEVSQ